MSLPVGVLLGGLVCGWLRSVRPSLFGQIPGPTLWIFESIGLAGFVAVVGLNAGPDFVQGLKQSGLSLLLAGTLTVSIALLIGGLVGRWIFKMPPWRAARRVCRRMHGHACACGHPGSSEEHCALDWIWRGVFMP